MKFLAVVALAVLAPLSIPATGVAQTRPTSAPEYAKHFAALGKLTVSVAQAMPPDEYAFRPDPPSMAFGELMTHIAQTNYAFCYGLKDSQPPAMPEATGKDAIVKVLDNSFSYCSGVIANLSDEQLNNPHSSPDGRLSGREILLVFYIHVAHHRGQAEIYLRDKGIAPPPYRI
jgi:uncharacterized damage-inducible protein DinB